MVANPEPEIAVWPLERQRPVIQRHACRPDFLPVALSELFELQ